MKNVRLLAALSLVLGACTITHAQSIVFDLDGSGLYGSTPLDLGSFTDINGNPPPPNIHGIAELKVAATTIDHPADWSQEYNFFGSLDAQIKVYGGQNDEVIRTFDLTTFGLNDPQALGVYTYTDAMLNLAGIIHTLWNLSQPGGFNLGHSTLIFDDNNELWNPPHVGIVQLFTTDVPGLFSAIEDETGVNPDDWFTLPLAVVIDGQFTLFSQPVPEPSTIGILGFGGLLGFVVLRRRAGKKTA